MLLRENVWYYTNFNLTIVVFVNFVMYSKKKDNTAKLLPNVVTTGFVCENNWRQIVGYT